MKEAQISGGVVRDRPTQRSRVQQARSLRVAPMALRLVTDLDEICEWLGTYRERLRLARPEERSELSSHVRQWSDRLQQRGAELA
jgi:hypothetical protein